jgi:hypothetical protein
VRAITSYGRGRIVRRDDDARAASVLPSTDTKIRSRGGTVKKSTVGVVVALAMTVGAGSALAVVAAKPDTQRMVLRASDLPAGFSPHAAAYVTNAQQTAASAGDRDYDKLGRVIGYSASYQRSAATGLIQVESEANLYRSAALAHSSYTSGLKLVLKQKELPVARIPLRGFPGAEAAFFKATPPGKTPLDLFVVVWRTGSVISTVTGGGLAGSVDRSAVVALARKQQARIAAGKR